MRLVILLAALVLLIVCGGRPPPNGKESTNELCDYDSGKVINAAVHQNGTREAPPNARGPTPQMPAEAAQSADVAPSGIRKWDYSADLSRHETLGAIYATYNECWVDNCIGSMPKGTVTYDQSNVTITQPECRPAGSGTL